MDHVAGWYSHAEDFNILFLTYEEMKKVRPISITAFNILSSYIEYIFRQLFISTLYTGKYLIRCGVDSNWDFWEDEVICLIGSRSYKLLDNY